MNQLPLFFVGIAGGSGSGKTTFARKVLQRLSKAGFQNAAHIYQDWYYLEDASAHDQKLFVDGKPNFDHPKAFDWDLMLTHLEMLHRKEQVACPIYDFTISKRSHKTVATGPCQVILFEGIFALWDPRIRDLLNLKIFLQVDSDVRFIRRLSRDVRERGRTMEGVIKQYYDTVRPMYKQHLEPTQHFADLLVGEEHDRAADLVSALILNVVSSSHDAN